MILKVAYDDHSETFFTDLNDEYNEYFSLLMLPPEKLEDYPLDVSYVFKGKKKRAKSKVPAAKKTAKGKSTASTTSSSSKASTKGSSTTARKTATDDFADFKTFVGKSSASGYCTSIRKIMREMGLNTLADLEASLPAAINHCTSKMGSAANKKESKLYSDYRAALRRYEKFLLSVKVCP